MKAILMAAGVGSRISREINCPKSLLNIGDGEPLIVHTIKLLQSYNIDVAVVLGYKKENFYETLGKLGVTFYENPFYRVTNSLASLWFARDFINNDHDYIFMNADVFVGTEIIERLVCDQRRVCLLGDYRTIKTGDYFFKLENGCVKKYGKQELPEEDRDCEYVGIAKISHAYVDRFKEKMMSMIGEEKYGGWWENILYSQCEELDLEVLDVDPYFWSEIDYIEDYEKIRKHISENEKINQ